ncbi:Two-component sensor histidine kinase [Labilithrix luteola]|uniref:histidine kinase n=1 Tax=Labilithrix luteola TaxID=1391654 RepID=A0A0K1Q2I0_9BACT|nr:ATP-binding protein [Labilithrix luteola]AKU99937.1 Two-component sensor histidine kinase [Labilithrix luteola]
MIEDPITNATLAPVNVLVVDDHAESRSTLRAILGGPTYRVVEASSGSEALRRLLAEEFAVLLIDVTMPDMSGFELASAIREREKTASVPILFMTGLARDMDLVFQGHRAGTVDYVTTPLSPETVRAKVAVFAQLARQRARIEFQAAQLASASEKESELRLVELRLASERRYRKLADAVPEIIWTARADGYADYFNRRWFEYTGIYTADASERWLSVVHPEDIERIRQGWVVAVRTGEMFEQECRLRRADGTYRWHLCRAIPEKSASEVSWLGTFTDIDDQKRASQLLADFKGTLDAVLDAVLIFDVKTWRISYANEGAALLLGYETDELAKMHASEFMTEYEETRLRELAAKLEHEDKSSVALETICSTKDGREIPVEFSFQLVHIDRGHVVSIARDITARKLAEVEREQLYGEALSAINARDDFLSIASHELRSPLSSLQLLIETLMRAPGDSASRGTDKLGLAARQVEKLSRLISELMDVSRISAGRLHLELEDDVDLGALVRDVVTRFREDAKKAACPVTLEVDETAIGRWDRLRMEQVATNLLTNALKYGAGKPVRVVVRRDREGDSVHLEVRDGGMGIAPEDAERIFERYERTSSAKKHSGLGLGLYILRQIVDAHGGTVHVESEPGKGSTFIVDLPLEAKVQRSGPASQVEPVSGPRSPRGQGVSHSG